MLGGVAGHAGLFGTGLDLAKLGQLWLNKGQYGDTRFFRPETVDLFTAPNTSSNFVPTAAQWNSSQSSSIASTYHVSDFRFKFEFESNGGNNVYIDDINLNGVPTGLDELVLGTQQGFVIAPTPANDRITVRLAQDRAVMTRLELLDVTGRSIHTVLNSALAPGEHRIELALGDLGSGVYFLRAERDGAQEVQRFVVE